MIVFSQARILQNNYFDHRSFDNRPNYLEISMIKEDCHKNSLIWLFFHQGSKMIENWHKKVENSQFALRDRISSKYYLLFTCTIQGIILIIF